MNKKSEFWYILIFLGILILACFFPLNGEDLFWSNLSVDSFMNALNTKGIGIMPSILLFVLAKVKLLRMIFVAGVTTCLVILIKNMINKKNITLSFIALFLILLSDKIGFSHFFASITGFTTHLVGSLVSLIFMRYFVSNSIVRMNSVMLIILGFMVGILNPIYLFLIFISTLIYMLLCKDEAFRKKYLMLLLGEVLGILLTVLLTKCSYTGFSNNLLHEFTKNIRGNNFLCLFIYSSLVLFLSVRVFIKGNKLYSVLSILGISLFLFVSLLSHNDILLYLSYIAYFFGTFYILFNFKTNKLFKYKVFTYHLFKILFIILLCIFGNIGSGSVILLYLVDIVFILEMYDAFLPKNFLKYVWIGIILCVLGVNIYIYRSVAKKYIEMNRYIKNELECSIKDVSIPNKYKSEYIYKVIPSNSEEFWEYVKYYKIDLYDKERDVTLEFMK